MSEDKEIAAMAAIAKAMDELGAENTEAKHRVLQWASARYGIKLHRPNSSADVGAVSINPGAGPKNQNTSAPDSTHETFADLFHAVDPTTDSDRALVAGYWLGQGKARVEFTGLDANKELKNLGHPIGNITDALTSLIERRPALVLQTAKSGSGKQARKKYKLSEAGITEIHKAINKPAE